MFAQHQISRSVDNLALVSQLSPCVTTEPTILDRLSVALKEIIDARVWGGIHFRTADVQGSVLGNKVAHYLEKHYFQPAN